MAACDEIKSPRGRGKLMPNLVPFSLRYAFTKWRLSRVTRPIDRQIADARRKHKPVRHLIAAKEAAIMSALKSGRAG